MEEQKEEKEKVRKLKYKVEKFTITTDNISKFKILENRRLVSDTHVARLHGVLGDGGNPTGVLIVNKVGNDLRLIDGNHRVEAIKKYFSFRSRSDLKIECHLRMYQDLTPAEERIIYSEEANRRNETHEDKLNMFKDTLTFWKLLHDYLDPFPCEVMIYPGKKGVRFRMLLNALATIKNSAEKGGYKPTALRKDEIIEFAETLGYDDFLSLKEFLQFFIKVYGVPESMNVYVRAQFFNPLFDIYTKNKQYKDDKTFAQRFEKIIARSELINFSSSGGREVQIRVRKIMLDYMNVGYTVKEFV